MPVTLELTVAVRAPAEQVWAALVDWPRQGEWMLGTTVRATDRDGQGVGGGLSAFTGVGRAGFLDTMVITVWEPPARCDVRHTGRVVRGTGTFQVRPGPTGSSVFVWREDLQLPLGRVGAAGWWLVRPLARWGVARSLKAFARWVEAARPVGD